MLFSFYFDLVLGKFTLTVEKKSNLKLRFMLSCFSNFVTLVSDFLDKMFLYLFQTRYNLYIIGSSSIICFPYSQAYLRHWDYKTSYSYFFGYSTSIVPFLSLCSCATFYFHFLLFFLIVPFTVNKMYEYIYFFIIGNLIV